MIGRIDTPGEFTRCVRAIGGEVLDDTQADDGRIADYWFSQYETTIELRCLRKDLVADATFAARLAQMLDRWIREGKIPDSRNPRVRVNLREIPIDCAREFLSVLKRRLEPIVSKANEQIEATKARLERPNAKGWLLVANDGNLVWKPDVFTYLIYRNLLEGQRTSIHAVAYFSANRPVMVPGVPVPAFFWIDGILPGREPPPGELRRNLESAWTQHHARPLQLPVVAFEATHDPSIFEQIAFADVPDGVYRFDCAARPRQELDISVVRMVGTYV